ncbi:MULTISPECIES: hypothetical protein [unclassified Moraxella]|uniref:hypothetical protein n=1 Tax=unclassified Moraxella TaxID=2685852 RepID=UPI003AF53F7E
MKIDVNLDKVCRDMDFSQGKSVSEIPALKARQDKKALENTGFNKESTLLDEDISRWLVSQNSETKRHFNEMVRHALAMQGVSFA